MKRSGIIIIAVFIKCAVRKMAQTSYETPLDANFISAYEMYNQQVLEFEEAHVRKRRNAASDYDRDGAEFEHGQTNDADHVAAPPVPAPRKLSENGETPSSGNPTMDGPKRDKSVIRLLVNSLLIGYTAVLLYRMAADGQSRRDPSK